MSEISTEEWVKMLYPPSKPKTEREKRVLIPRKERKNPCVAEYYTDEQLIEKKMIGKFDNLPVESYITILFETPARFNEYDVLYQKCDWEGITAESLIFLTDDIQNITMDELENEIRNSPMVADSSKEITTSSGKSEYTFFNFNFVIDE